MPTDSLEGALQNCSLHVLLMLTQQAFGRLGFGDVEILDRRRSRQKSRFGGFEMMCRLTVGDQPGVVLVKVVRDQVRTRMVHELAGCVLERDALFGLLVSPFERSAKAKRTQAIDPKLRVRLVEGGDLANLLKCSGLGTRPGGCVDYAFLAELEERSKQFLDYLSFSTQPDERRFTLGGTRDGASEDRRQPSGRCGSARIPPRSYRTPTRLPPAPQGQAPGRLHRGRHSQRLLAA